MSELRLFRISTAKVYVPLAQLFLKYFFVNVFDPSSTQRKVTDWYTDVTLMVAIVMGTIHSFVFQTKK